MIEIVEMIEIVSAPLAGIRCAGGSGGGVELMIVGILWFWGRVRGMGFAGDLDRFQKK